MAESRPSPELFDAIVNLCVRRGFVFRSAEIYGGFRSAYDYGPLGVLLLRNVKEQWWRSIPEPVRPHKEQPYYHLLAVGERGPYVAYVSEQNLLSDAQGGPVPHPQVHEIFGELREGHYELKRHRAN